MGLTTAALVLCAVAGHPETLLFAVAAGGVFFLAELVRARPGRRLPPVLGALGAGALALGLSAVVLLPVLEALPQTLQHALRAVPAAWGSRTAPAVEVLRRLVPSVVPYAFGWPGHGDFVGRLILPAAYAGSLLWPFAAAGLAAPGRRRWIFAAFVAGGLALNARVAGIAGPLSKLPLFDIAVNDYFVFVAVFGLAGLGVLGAERLRRGEGAGAFVAGAIAAVAVAGVAAAVRAEGLSFLGIDREFLWNHILLQTVPPLAAAVFVRVRGAPAHARRPGRRRPRARLRRPARSGRRRRLRDLSPVGVLSAPAGARSDPARTAGPHDRARLLVRSQHRRDVRGRGRPRLRRDDAEGVCGHVPALVPLAAEQLQPRERTRPRPGSCFWACATFSCLPA